MPKVGVLGGDGREEMEGILTVVRVVLQNVKTPTGKAERRRHHRVRRCRLKPTAGARLDPAGVPRRRVHPSGCLVDQIFLVQRSRQIFD